MTDKDLPEYSFHPLPFLRITTDQGSQTFPDISVVNALHHIDSAKSLLDEICLDYESDIKENRPLLEAWPSVKIRPFESFLRREIWRTGSYILFALNLKGVLDQLYKRVTNLVKEVKPGGVIPDTETLLSKRKEEIEIYRNWRNKVFAHTAFGDPIIEERAKRWGKGKEPDSLTMQYTSLAYLSGLLHSSVTPEGVVFGSGAIGYSEVVAGEAEFVIETLPDIKFAQIVLDFDIHFYRWYEMYRGLFNRICALSDDEIRKYYEETFNEQVLRIDRPKNSQP